MMQECHIIRTFRDHGQVSNPSMRKKNARARTFMSVLNVSLFIMSIMDNDNNKKKTRRKRMKTEYAWFKSCWISL